MSAASLGALRSRLSAGMARPLPEDRWTGPEHMEAARQRVEALFECAALESIDTDHLARVLRRLADDEPLSDRELRLACMGATTPVPLTGGDTRVVDDETLTRRLLARVRLRANPRTQRRCAFGLAHAYLVPPVEHQGAARVNAALTAEFVLDHADAAAPEPARRYSASLLGQTRELFARNSTAQFGSYVFNRDASVLTPLQRLGAPATSWIWGRIVLDAIQLAARTDDGRFLHCVDQIVDALHRHPLTLDRGLAALLERCARGTASRAANEVLLKVSVERWGSPLLPERHPYWLRWVDEETRRMVAGWITRRVIAAFFETLAGPAADLRRTLFWSRYADRIDEMVVYLGEQTRSYGGKPVQEMRSALGSAVKGLNDEVTNAFVMTIGGYAFVEFSTVGHALYVYERHDLPFEKTRGLPRTTALKDRDRAVDRITHQGAWEQRAAQVVGDLSGAWVRRY